MALADARLMVWPELVRFLVVFDDVMYDEFSAYWHSMSREDGHLVPSRKSVKPTEIKSILPHVFMSEIVGHMDVRVRLTGTFLDMISANRLTGMNYLDVCPEEERTIYWQLAQVITSLPCGHWMIRDVTFVDGKGFRLKQLIYPLRNRHGESNMVFGIMGTSRNAEVDGLKPMSVIKSTILESKFLDVGAGIPELPENAALAAS